MVVPHPREELHVHTKEEWLGQIKSCLGSYVAEKLKFGTTTTGVSEDFRQAMWYAHQMVWRFGMGGSGLIGDYTLLETSHAEYGVFRGEKVSFLSENIKEKLNQETQDILQACLKEVEDMLRKEMPILNRFAEELLKKEELDYDEIEAIFKEFGKSRPPVI